MSAATASPSVQPSDAPQTKPQKPPPSCGPLLDSLSADFQLHPYDVVLAIGSMLGNIAGPHAGFVTPDDELVRPALNVLHVDDGDSAPRSLFSALVQPLRARARMIRNRAAGHNRAIVDHHTFGVCPAAERGVLSGDLSMALKQRSHTLAEAQEELVQMQGLPFEHFSYLHLSERCNFAHADIPWAASTPGINHLPSLFAEGLELKTVPRLLQETLHREAFLYHPVSALSGRADPFAAKQDEEAGRLAVWLQGQDMQFAPVHAGQGHGTFDTARVSLWSALDHRWLGRILSRPASQWNDVLKQCLLWRRSELPEFKPSTASPREARGMYVEILHSVLELRCHGSYQNQRRLALNKIKISRYRELKRLFLAHIDRVDAQDLPFVGQFHDLYERLLWVLMQFSTEQHPTSYISCANNVAFHALKMQVRVLKQARRAAEEASLDAHSACVIRVLSRKGPLSLRDIQRSTDKLSKSELMPGLERLIQIGQVQQDSDRRFCLVSPSGSATPPVNLALRS
jgi:hypothetical protein